MDQAIEETGSIFLVGITLLLVVRLVVQLLFTQDLLGNMVTIWISQMIR